jgi:SET domain-containing protein
MLKPLTDEALLDPPYLVVRPSAINGKGVFTTKPCRAGEVLFIIAGEVIDGAECERREDEEGNCVIYYHDDDRYIDPAPTNKAKFLNHSCAANAIPETRDDSSLYVIALRDIQPGEEVCIDYDFDDIYDICRQANPQCRHDGCPLRARWNTDDAASGGG